MANPMHMLAAVELLNNRIFEDQYLEKLYMCLSRKWSKFQSLSAALKLMESHGVQLTPEEESRMGEMSEPQMIEALVQKMPNQSKEQFQSFFLQLQIIVTTATRVRQALEDCRPDLIQVALKDADASGMSNYILKMATVTAGTEVVALKQQHIAWVKDAEHRMSKLVRGQEDAMKARKKLAAAQSQLAMQRGTNDTKKKSALMALTSGGGAVLLQATFLEWRHYIRNSREEREIYEEFREAIERVETQLVDLKAKQMKGVRGVMGRKGDAKVKELLLEVFVIWQECVETVRFDKANKGAIEDLEKKLKDLEDQQSSKVQKVMMKMLGESENALIKLVFGGFVKFHQDYQKNKAQEDQLKLVEQQVKGYMKGKSAGNQSIMTKMAGATDAGLVHSVFDAWKAQVLETKMENEMAEELAKSQSKFSTFGGRNKRGAMSALDRARLVQEQQTLSTMFLKWRMDTHMEFLMREGSSKIEGKRIQLAKVQTMFRDFAQKLEQGIKTSQDSERDIAQGPPLKKSQRKGMVKADASVSLPDIHTSKPEKESHGSKPPKPSKREKTDVPLDNEPGASGRRR